jgi:hypothetical protein
MRVLRFALLAVVLAACDEDRDNARGSDAPAASEAGKGSKNVKTEPRTVEVFDRINASGLLELRVTVGKPLAVSVTTDDNLLASVKTSTRSKTLYIETHGDLRPSDALRVEVSVPALDDLRVDGAVGAKVEGRTQADTDFHAQASGSSTLELVGPRAKSLGIALAGAARADAKDVNAKRFHVSINGVGAAVCTGAAEDLRVDIDGAGKADLSKVAAKDVTVSLNGTAQADVDVANTLSVRASGAASLVYSGNPTHLTKSAPAPAVVKPK